jgi:hypothetical protein
MEKASPNNQAPIIPPTAMLASNQKNQIASLKPAFRVRGRGTIVSSARQSSLCSTDDPASDRSLKAPRSRLVGPPLDTVDKRCKRRVRLATPAERAAVRGVGSKREVSRD